MIKIEKIFLITNFPFEMSRGLALARMSRRRRLGKRHLEEDFLLIRKHRTSDVIRLIKCSCMMRHCISIAVCCLRFCVSLSTITRDDHCMRVVQKIYCLAHWVWENESAFRYYQRAISVEAWFLIVDSIKMKLIFNFMSFLPVPVSQS